MKHSKILQTLLVTLLGTFLLSSCASIVNSGDQEVRIASVPDRANVYLNGEAVGSTPINLELERGEQYNIELKKKGYKSATIVTDKELSGWFWANLLHTGIIGMPIDLLTGAAYNIIPPYMNVHLEKGEGSRVYPVYTADDPFFENSVTNALNTDGIEGTPLSEQPFLTPCYVPYEDPQIINEIIYVTYGSYEEYLSQKNFISNTFYTTIEDEKTFSNPHTYHGTITYRMPSEDFSFVYNSVIGLPNIRIDSTLSDYRDAGDIYCEITDRIKRKAFERYNLLQLMKLADDNEISAIEDFVTEVNRELSDYEWKYRQIQDSIEFSRLTVIWNVADTNDPLNEIKETVYAVAGLNYPDEEPLNTFTDELPDETHEGLYHKIYLDKKCQIIHIYGVKELPPIDLSPDIPKEQIVVTPLVGDDCEIIGFEVRAGSIESGCTEGKQALKKFRKCYPMGK